MWHHYASLQDLKLNRIEIEEAVDMKSPSGQVRPKKRKKTYDMNATDNFWITHKGRYAD